VTGPSWKHRRRLIYATYVLAVGMIVFAMATYRSDTSVASQALVGAVSLISIILTAYTAFATLDDKWHWVRDDSSPDGEDSSGTEVHYNFDTPNATDWTPDEVR
jgi:hypothetical protein